MGDGDPERASDEALMRAHVEGDPRAMRALFRRHAAPLIRVMQTHTGNEADARDIVQAAFLNLHRARRDFRPDAKLRPWLYTIAYNLMRDHHRYRGRRPEQPADPADQDRTAIERGTIAPDARLRGQAVRDALATLPAGQREVIALHWFEGFSFAEIAVIVGARRSAVKVRAHRGYKKLRAELEARGVTSQDAGA